MNNDVSHLEAGMRVILAVRLDDESRVGSDRLSATLVARHGGALATEGGICVRRTDGSAGPGVLEVLDPLPPVKFDPLPVRTCKRSPDGDEAILANRWANAPWFVYRGGFWGTGAWLTHKDVADWEIISEGSIR